MARGAEATRDKTDDEECETGYANAYKVEIANHDADADEHRYSSSSAVSLKQF